MGRRVLPGGGDAGVGGTTDEDATFAPKVRSAGKNRCECVKWLMVADIFCPRSFVAFKRELPQCRQQLTGVWIKNSYYTCTLKSFFY